MNVMCAILLMQGIDIYMHNTVHVAMQGMQNTVQYNQHDFFATPNPMVVVTSNASNDSSTPPGPTAAEHPGASNGALDVDTASTPLSSTGSLTNLANMTTQRPCVLCQYHGNTAVVTKRILAYMEDAVNHVHEKMHVRESDPARACRGRGG